MKASVFGAVASVLVASVALAIQSSSEPLPRTPPGESVSIAAKPAAPETVTDPDTLAAWRRPDGPVRIALQAGHWKAAEAPDEQAGLRDNGARAAGLAEWEVNLEIARSTAQMLRDSGYTVEILPTTIQPGYWADLFVSIHADGHSSPRISGYRAAAPRRDLTGRAAEFASLLDRTYGEETGLPYYGSVTRRMRGYYAFNYRRYEHALHPMTVGVILETGFLTSPADREVIVQRPERAARGIVRAVTRFVSPVPPIVDPAVTRSLSLRPHSPTPPPDADQTR